MVPALPVFAAVPGGRNLRIDSIETPRFAPGPYTVRLSGGQLGRFEALRDLFSQNHAVSVESHLDGAGQVLLDAALHAAGVPAWTTLSAGNHPALIIAV